ncbi:hypothetical protein BDQ12DRAFT_714940 [Crucibulum laeve]|uniref:Uncharacterized protein n=1 Tax=Crucibulum laeve TaxID=68775 RepID=A0A5C3LQD2_9AGAR|nr:hypothetical protein BDQ12DRAFT_714940 [Crucibulum laeve]
MTQRETDSTNGRQPSQNHLFVTKHSKPNPPTPVMQEPTSPLSPNRLRAPLTNIKSNNAIDATSNAAAIFIATTWNAVFTIHATHSQACTVASNTTAPAGNTASNLSNITRLFAASPGNVASNSAATAGNVASNSAATIGAYDPEFVKSYIPGITHINIISLPPPTITHTPQERTPSLDLTSSKASPSSPRSAIPPRTLDCIQAALRTHLDRAVGQA